MEDNDVSFGGLSENVYVWIIGKLTENNRIATVVYGQFTRLKRPPSDAWIFLGLNLDRDLNSVLRDVVTTYPDLQNVEMPSLQGLQLDVGQSRSFGKSLTAEEMRLCKDDDVLVEKQLYNNFGDDDSDSMNYVYHVSQSSLHILNGRYLHFGELHDAPVYRNVRGWMLFRHSLIEIPELGIYADGCYDAVKGKSITALLDKRAGKL